jgi:hypothetical protein
MTANAAVSTWDWTNYSPVDPWENNLVVEEVEMLVVETTFNG